MAARRIALIGAGNMAAAPQAAASLAVYAPPFHAEIRLFDANDERLDLMDRFTRCCLDRSESGHTLISTSDPAEALEAADATVICLEGDCARRMLGTRAPVEVVTMHEPQAIYEMSRGDINRPTPVENLSPRVQQLLASPAEPDSSEEAAILAALNLLVKLLPSDCRSASLMRGAEVPWGHTFLNWPAQLSDESVRSVPHQLLRWIRSDNPLDPLLDEARRSPLLAWLSES